MKFNLHRGRRRGRGRRDRTVAGEGEGFALARRLGARGSPAGQLLSPRVASMRINAARVALHRDGAARRDARNDSGTKRPAREHLAAHQDRGAQGPISDLLLFCHSMLQIARRMRTSLYLLLLCARYCPRALRRDVRNRDPSSALSRPLPDKSRLAHMIRDDSFAA